MGCTSSKPELEISNPTPTDVPTIDQMSTKQAVHKRPVNLRYEEPIYPPQQTYQPRNRNSVETLKDFTQVTSAISSDNTAIVQTLSSDRTMTNKSIIQLDNIMDMIKSLQIEEQFDKNLNSSQVYEEHWEFDERISRRISSFYGDIFDSYEYQESDPNAYSDFKNTLGRNDTKKLFDPRRFTFQPDSLPVEKQTTEPIHDCAFCQLPIQDHSVFLMGRYWHKYHAQCAECHRPLGLDNFAEINDFLYCEDHYVTVRGKPVIKKESLPKTELDKELLELKQRNTVRKVRNLFTFQRSLRVNMLSVVEDEFEDKRQRYVMSWIAPTEVEQ
jgi:hypothetical protein